MVFQHRYLAQLPNHTKPIYLIKHVYLSREIKFKMFSSRFLEIHYCYLLSPNGQVHSTHVRHSFYMSHAEDIVLKKKQNTWLQRV